MTVQEIKQLVEKHSGIGDLSTRQRDAPIPAMKGIFYNLARRLGHRDKELTDIMDQNRTSIYKHIYNHEFNYKKDRTYRNIYDTCYNIVNGIEEVKTGVRPRVIYLNRSLNDSLIEKLFSLSDEKLVEFEETRLDPYIRMNVKVNK